MSSDNLQLSFGDICTPSKLVQENPELFNDSGMSWMLKSRERNGLAESGAVLKVSGKIYIIRNKFLDWFINQKAN